MIYTFVEKSISKSSACVALLLLLLLQDVVVVVVALQGRVPVPAAHDDRLLLLRVSWRRRQEWGVAKFSGPRGILTHHCHWLPSSRSGGGRGLDHHRRWSGRRIIRETERHHTACLEAHGWPVSDLVNLLDPGLDSAQLGLQT